MQSIVVTGTFGSTSTIEMVNVTMARMVSSLQRIRGLNQPVFGRFMSVIIDGLDYYCESCYEG